MMNTESHTGVRSTFVRLFIYAQMQAINPHTD